MKKDFCLLFVSIGAVCVSRFLILLNHNEFYFLIPPNFILLSLLKVQEKVILFSTRYNSLSHIFTLFIYLFLQNKTKQNKKHSHQS